METSDIARIDARINRLSDKFEKALMLSCGPTVLAGIKTELDHCQEQKKNLLLSESALLSMV